MLRLPCVLFDCRLVAYADKASVKRILRSSKEHAMFGDNLTLSPVLNAPEPPSEEQHIYDSASHDRANDRCYALHAAMLSSVAPTPADHACLAVCCRTALEPLDLKHLPIPVSFKVLLHCDLHTDKHMVRLQASRAAPVLRATRPVVKMST